MSEEKQLIAEKKTFGLSHILATCDKLQVICYIYGAFIFARELFHGAPMVAVWLSHVTYGQIDFLLRLIARNPTTIEYILTFTFVFFGTPLFAVVNSMPVLSQDKMPKALFSPDLVAALKYFAKTKGGLFLMFAAIICGSHLVSTLASPTTSLLFMSFLGAGLLPAGSAWLAFIMSKPKSMQVGNKSAASMTHTVQPQTSWMTKFAVGLRNSSEHFVRYLLPYVSVQAAFLLFWGILSFAPNGFGVSVASWIQGSLYDANIERVALPSTSTILWTSAVLFFSIVMFLSPYAVRAGIVFQSFVNRFIGHSGDFLELLTRTLRDKGRTVTFKKTVSWTADYFQSLGWFSLCYIGIFAISYLSTFEKTGLGAAIGGTVSGSAFGISPALASNPKMGLFLSSIYAGYGTAVMAVTCCVFLPNRTKQKIHFDKDGISEQLNIVGYFTGWPWRSWKHLDSVTLHNAGKARTMRLNFQDGHKLNIRIDNVTEEDLRTLLAAADEYSPSCKFSDEALSIKNELDLKHRNSPSQPTNSFESTIFRVHQCGDIILGGKCRIVKQLTSRPLSAVYLARSADGRLVIVKQFVTPDQSTVSVNWKNTLKREYELIMKCERESISRVHDVIDQDGSTYLLIEHIEGSDLRAIVDELGERSENTVLRWAKEIAESMAYLHGLDVPIIHRDLTPDNIMITDKGRIKIIDFGAAHQFMEGVTGTLVGKQCYIAPEQLRGKLSMSSDIYSFGCTLYFLCTGKDPRALSMSDPNHEGWQLSPKLNELIRRCTQFNESERFASFGEILTYLDSELSDFQFSKNKSLLSSIDDPAFEEKPSPVSDSRDDVRESIHPTAPSKISAQLAGDVETIPAHDSQDGEALLTVNPDPTPHMVMAEDSRSETELSSAAPETNEASIKLSLKTTANDSRLKVEVKRPDDRA